MIRPVYELTLHKTYYRKGFFNLGVSVDRFVQLKDGFITIRLGETGRQLIGRSDRKANQNGTPRIHVGVELTDWFVSHFEEKDIIDVIILSKNTIQLRKKTQ